MRAIFLLSFVLATTAGLLAASAQENVTINVPKVAYANVYSINTSSKVNGAEPFERAGMLAERFAVPLSAMSKSEQRGEPGGLMGILYGENQRWTYGYFPQSGYEDFVDRERFLMPSKEKNSALIDKSEAIGIALELIDGYFEDSERSEIREVKFYRVWDEVQLTPDEEERIIQKTSDEAVVKLSRTIDGLPVMGHGGFRIHIANDGTVVGAFRRCRHVNYVPIDSVALPTKTELQEIADETLWKYCRTSQKCDLKIDVGYFEAGAGTRQELLEPVVVVTLSQLTKGGEDIATKYTIPIRDANIAENIMPENREE